MSDLSQDELDFVRWMDELDLEAVNLLAEQKHRPDDVGADVPDAAERGRLSGEGKNVELPEQRGVGWD